MLRTLLMSLRTNLANLHFGSQKVEVVQVNESMLSLLRTLRTPRGLWPVSLLEGGSPIS